MYFSPFKKISFLGLFLLVLISHAAAETEFPYTAVVNDDSVYVYSGPGSTHYTTDVFQKGDSVEVHRHLPGGWCAIRPPAGSFSWVPRVYVQILGDGLAKITAEEIPSRIGSRLHPAQRSQYTVSLRNGKVVEILDMSRDLGDWCKISPPSGEFRWVQAKFLSSPAEMTFSSQKSAAFSVSGNDLSAVPAAKPSVSSRDFLWHLNLLESDLSRTMANYDASRWDTPNLLMRANSLANRADTVTQKEQVDVVRQRILQAEEVRRRKVELLRIEANSHGGEVLAGRNTSGVSAAASADPFAQPRFSHSSGGQDITPTLAPYSTTPGRFEYDGYLKAVQPQEKKDFSLPRYALLDDRECLRCYVTPPPGMDLTKYVGARVGISGTRVYKPEHEAMILTAREVRELSATAGR